MEKIKNLYLKYQEIINYLIVGVLTTIVSWGAKFIGTFWLDSTIGWQNFILSTINWTAGVIFGYFANRIFVFHSKEKNMFLEFVKFAGGRVFTYFMDVVIMLVLTVWISTPGFFVSILNGVMSIVGKGPSTEDLQVKLWYWGATLFSAVMVTITNYILSKVFVFRNKKKEKKEEE